MKIKAVFFDAGETLIYRNPSMVTITKRYLDSAGKIIKRKKLAEIINSAAAEMRPVVERGKMSDSGKWKMYIAGIFRRLGIKNRALEDGLRAKLKCGTSFRAFRDAHMTVDYLNRRGIITGIISNASATLGGILKRVGLYNKFRHIVVSETEGVEKPEKAIFMKALRLSRCRAEHTLYIGDNYVADVYGSLNAGFVPVWVKRNSKNAEFSYRGVSKNPVRTVTSLEGLLILMKTEGWL